MTPSVGAVVLPYASFYLFPRRFSRFAPQTGDRQENALRRMIPKRNPVVQKFRSSIHTSWVETVFEDLTRSDRSCAWPCSQGNPSMASIKLGSSTTSDCPGKAPAWIVRNSLMRCSVDARWLPSRILTR